MIVMVANGERMVTDSKCEEKGIVRIKSNEEVKEM
jgi:hypothetical protein